MTIIFSAIFSLFIQAPVPVTTIDSLENSLASASGKQKIILLNELYKQYVNNDAAKALNYTTEALALAEEIKDASGISSSYNNIGVVYKNRGDLDKALENYIRATVVSQHS